MSGYEFDFYDKTSLKSYNLEATMRYQLSMLENLDNVTRTHSENVASLVCRICEYLRCKTSFTSYCTISAYLHDIGKLYIPKEIVNKPEKLTDSEYEIMKTHTLIGYKICMDDLQLRPYALGVKYHHESLNGTGYPESLKGSQIPYEAQIIKVADEYDAIVAKRQYKTHINISETLKKLLQESIAEEHIKSVALDSVAVSTKAGRMNRKVVKALFKVVIDDTAYEISCVSGYIDFLKEQIKRLNCIIDYNKKMDIAKNEKKKNYYKEGMRMLFNEGETFENYKQVYEEYERALENRTEIINKLYNEIKIIKKLRV